MEIKGFLETSFVDWPEKICSVLFLPYCNFRCPYCHNHALVLRPHHFETLPWSDIQRRLGTFSGWLNGVCVTGGEPTLHPDLSNLLSAIKSLGFLVKLDTNGLNPLVIKRLLEDKLVDYIAVDVKTSPEKYDFLAGCRVDFAASRACTDQIGKIIIFGVRT